MTIPEPLAPTNDTRPERLLTFWSGGWLIGLAILFCLLSAGFHVWMSYQSIQLRDGEAPSRLATNGFDLSRFDGDLELVRKGTSFNGLPTIVDPETDTIEAINESPRWKASWGKDYLLDSDLVIGVAVSESSPSGERTVARAYPTRIVQWHETVNDELGGVPILVSFSFLTRSAVVFDRRLDGETLEFASSGLLHNENPLMSDRLQIAEDASLWQQASGICVHGPRRGQRLTVLPAELVTLADWRARHPETTAMPGQPTLAKKKRYESGMHRKYYADERLPNPAGIRPLPEDPASHFDRLLLVHDDASEIVAAFSFDEVAERVTVTPEVPGVWETEVPAIGPVRLIYMHDLRTHAPTLRIERTNGDALRTSTMLRFAAHSLGLWPTTTR